MTHLNFEWGGDKYTWDLTKAGKCTLGYVIIFVTGYHFLHVVMGLLKDLTEAREAKAKKDNINGKEKNVLVNSKKSPDGSPTEEPKNKYSVSVDGSSSQNDNDEKKLDKKVAARGIEEKKKE